MNALSQRANAAQDDWATEQLHEDAKAQLHELQLVLQEDPDLDSADLSALVHEDFTPSALWSAHAEVTRSGSITCGRLSAVALNSVELESGTDARSVLAELFTSLESPVRVHFKIIAIEASEAGGFATTVLVQGAGTHGQFNARWSIDWSRDEETEPPRIHSIRSLELAQCSTLAPLFVDRSSNLLRGAGGRSALLESGCADWRGRVDGLGEENYFGHSGMAVADVNGDGLEDIYVATGTGLPNMLFLQQADGTVLERAAEAGVAWSDDTKGVLLIDYDNDGDRDLFCVFGSTIVVCANDGKGHFTVRQRMRAETTASFYSLAAADYDLDGDLDIYATRYVKSSYGNSIPRPFHDARNGPTNHLMRNEAGKGFTDVTDSVGLGVNNDRFSLAAAWIDYDGDGDSDLYVANDFGRNNLYRNDSGSFVDVAAESGTEDQAAGMGVSWADADLDGDFDLLVSNMFSSAGQRIAYQSRFKADSADLRAEIQHHSLGNSLFLNDGKGAFHDVSDAAGLRMGRWAWGARFSDFDGDGRPDVVVPNGFLTNTKSDDL